MEENNKEQTNARPTKEFVTQEAANETEPLAAKKPRVKWSSIKKLKVACAALAIGLALSLGGNIALASGGFNKPADMRHDAQMERSFSPDDRSADRAERPDRPPASEEGEQPNGTDKSERPDFQDKSGKSDGSKSDAGNGQEKSSEGQSGQEDNKTA